jgi:hypothetical protein
MAQASAPLIPDELATEAKAAGDAVKALDPPSISRMSDEQAYAILLRLRLAQLEVTQTVARGVGEKMSEQRFRAELAARGLGELFEEPFQRRVQPLEGKLSPPQKRQLERELGERYPAYGNYVKRALVSGVVLEMSRPRLEINAQYETSRRLPASIDAAKLQALRRQRGVSSAEYADGVFRVVLDEEVLQGGVVQLGATPKSDGTLEWRCSSSENVRQFVPQSCRQ